MTRRHRPGLREKGWQDVRKDLDHACASLDGLIRESARTVNGPQAGEDCRAFGQWVAQPEDTKTRRGQHGIYGTAAGLEILTSAKDPNADGELIHAAWVYLYWKLSEGPGRLRQFYIVLRQAMVLRSLSMLDWAVKNWSTPPPKIQLDTIRQLSNQLLSELRNSKYGGAGADDEEVRIWIDWPSAAKPNKEVSGYRFASKSPDAPSLATTWAFHQAAVLNAITECFRCDLLQNPEDYLVSEHVKTLVEWCNHILEPSAPDPVALRVAMFAGWAVLGLERGQPKDSGDRMAKLLDSISSEQRETLDEELERAVKSALRDRALQTDLHLPFLYRLPDGTQSTDEEAEEEKYRQEHLVVPTVPIMLSLAARLQGPLRFDRRYLDLLSTVIDCLRATKPTVVPAQATAANGTVNMAYLRSALLDVGNSLEQIANESPGWRLIQRVSWRRLLQSFLSNRWGWALITAVIAAIVAKALGAP